MDDNQINEFAKRMRQLSHRHENLDESLWDDQYKVVKDKEKDLRSSLNRTRGVLGDLGVKSYNSIAQKGDNTINNNSNSPIGKYQTTEEIGKHYVKISFANGSILEGNYYIVGEVDEHDETLTFYNDQDINKDCIVKIYFIGSFLKTQKNVDNFYDSHKLDITNSVYDVKKVDGLPRYEYNSKQRIKIIRIKRS
jgi:hypothetical protein